MPRCLQSVSSHFTPAGRIEPVVIVLAAVSILLGQTLEPIEEWTSNKLLTKGRRVDDKTPKKHILLGVQRFNVIEKWDIAQK